MNFREIVRKNQRFKLDKSNENKECIVLYKSWNWNQEKKETIKNSHDRRSRSISPK